MGVPYILCLYTDDRFEPGLLFQVAEAAYENDADMVMLERNDLFDPMPRWKLWQNDQKIDSG